MSAKYLFLLGQSRDEPITWVETQDDQVKDGGELIGPDDLSAFGEKIQPDDRCIALLPGEQVAMRLIPSAPKSAAKIDAAARYLLDDELGEPITGLHIITSLSEGAAYAVKSRIIDEWLEIFLTAGIHLDLMTADCLCLPIKDDKPTIFIGHKRTLAAFNNKRFAAENKLAEELLTQQLGDQPLEDFNIYRLQGAMSNRSTGQSASVQEIDTNGLIELFLMGLESAPVNLLQGKYKNVRRWKEGVQIWRRTGALAATLAVVTGLVFVAGGIGDLRAANAYERLAQELQQKYLPEASGRNLRSYANELLAAKQDANFIALTAAFTDAINQSQDVRLDRIRFDKLRGQMVVSIRSRNDASLESLRQALIANNIAAQESGGYRRIGQEWAGDIVVRLP